MEYKKEGKDAILCAIDAYIKNNGEYAQKMLDAKKKLTNKDFSLLLMMIRSLPIKETEYIDIIALFAANIVTEKTMLKLEDFLDDENKD